ncbi:MAG: LamG-like jellyroll fold domain-containing protein [Candidatus Delongbacteria bacterium]|jgi:hypothetical protein|nr:LamG-like jellyroll fold domain-containing protein [Candidatus Delongbacteria bacterium]
MNRFLFVIILAAAFSLFGAKSSGLVGYWTFDGANANDLTGSHDGTVVGSGVTFPAGKVGNAVNFSVGSSFIKIPSFNTDHITVEAWVNSAGYGYYTSMVTKNYYADKWSSPWTTWSLWFNENTANPGTISSQWATASPDVVSMNEWHHMAFTYDGTTVKMYVNGVEKSSYEPAGGPITQTAGNVYIGKPEYANHSFTGSIDEVAIWDNALPGTEILRHYQNGIAGIGYLTAPTVQTDSVTNVTISSASVMSEVVAENGSDVSERGVCWNTAGNATISDSRTFDGTGAGTFTSEITGLYAGRDYYVRSYAINSTGTSYGDELIFSTPDNPEGLVAYYPFSGNTNDESGYGNNAVNYGAVQVEDRYEFPNSAYSFNGTPNWMDIGDIDVLNPHLSDVSVSVWIKTTQQIPGEGARIYSKGTHGGTQPGYAVMLYPGQNGKTAFIFGIDGHEHIVLSNSVVNDGKWHLITGIADRDGNAQLYIDRVKETSQVSISPHALSDLASSTYNASIGVSYCTNGIPGALSEYFNGTIDEVRVFMRALSQQDVDQLYANYLPPEGLSGRAENMYNVLTWDTSEYGRLEKVRIFRDGAFLDEVIVDGPEDSLFNDTNVIPDSVYQYSITSVDTLGNESIKSQAVDVTAIFIPFTDTGAVLENVGAGALEWGDYDNDGDLDLFLCGLRQSNWPYNPVSKIYRNDEGAFTDISAPVYNSNRSSAKWGDYDNDGDIDLILTGADTEANYTRLYNNDSGSFSETATSLPDVQWSSVDWGDYDNDGDLDILIGGDYGSGQLTRIYKNEEGVFSDISAGLPGLFGGSAEWGDYDNDGDLDILISGGLEAVRFAQIYRNDGNDTFTDAEAGLPGVSYGFSSWGDYDNDGDLDIALTGLTSSGRISDIYRNDSGAFTNIEAGLPGVEYGSSEWGDYDNDGDLDLFLSGYDGTVRRTDVYRNEEGVFAAINAQFTGVGASMAAWGDYDNDGDLDIAVAGDTGSGMTTRIYQNNCVTPNTAPSSPANLAFVQDDNGLHFSYDPATDAETPSDGFSYNIDIDIGDGTIKAASSDLMTGKRRLTGMGNIQQNTSWTLNIEAPPETIPQQLFDMIWKVQAVDNCFAGSAFASKNDIVMTRDLVTVPKETMVATDALTWEYYMPADSIAGYTLQLSGDSLFADCFEAFMPKAKDNKAVYIGIDLLSLGVTDSLVNNERYFWRVKPEHVSSIENPTGFKKVPDSFIYDPVYSAPSPVSISVDGNYVTLEWGTGKEGEKTMLYNIYSSDDPHAVFPGGWTLVNSVTGTSYLMNSTLKKRFYCVTAAGSVK